MRNDHRAARRGLSVLAAALSSGRQSRSISCVRSALLGGAGFERYEVSSFARPGHRCKHNRAYWRNEAFWGFGLGATSHVGGRRVARPRKMDDYRMYVASLEEGGWETQQVLA